MTHAALIVANRTVGGDDLEDTIRQRMADERCTFHLLVPIASPVSSVVAVGAAAADMMPTGCIDFQNERELAEERLAYGLEWLASLEADATGELITDVDTASAVTRVVETRAVDEVIVSTLPTPISRWLRQDLPHRIERKVSVPVTVVTSSG